MSQYPCKDCLLITTCKEPCIKLPKVDIPHVATDDPDFDQCLYCGSLIHKSMESCPTCYSIYKYYDIVRFAK